MCLIISVLSYDVEMAERLDTMSSVKLDGFRSQLEVSYVSAYPITLKSCDSTKQSVDDYIYIYPNLNQTNKTRRKPLEK